MSCFKKSKTIIISCSVNYFFLKTLFIMNRVIKRLQDSPEVKQLIDLLGTEYDKKDYRR